MLPARRTARLGQGVDSHVRKAPKIVERRAEADPDTDQPDVFET